MIKELMSDKVPNLPNYENFMKATNKSTVFILAFMNFLMEMNIKTESEIHYMDSTPITVRMNHKIYSHKVTKGIARIRLFSRKKRDQPKTVLYTD